MITKHDRPIIGIDIDGTLRDFESQVEKYIEKDYPQALSSFRQIKHNEYRTLDKIGVFSDIQEVWKWMYEERVFELFGMAPRVHQNAISNLNIFAKAADQAGFDLVISTVQKNQSVTATLHWLSKWGSRIQTILCFNSSTDKLNSGIDIFIDDSPELLCHYQDVQFSPYIRHPSKDVDVPRFIKVPYKFNEHINVPSVDIPNGKFNDLYEILHIDRILTLEEKENNNADNQISN